MKLRLAAVLACAVALAACVSLCACSGNPSQTEKGSVADAITLYQSGDDAKAEAMLTSLDVTSQAAQEGYRAIGIARRINDAGGASKDDAQGLADSLKAAKAFKYPDELSASFGEIVSALATCAQSYPDMATGLYESAQTIASDLGMEDALKTAFPEQAEADSAKARLVSLGGESSAEAIGFGQEVSVPDKYDFAITSAEWNDALNTGGRTTIGPNGSGHQYVVRGTLKNTGAYRTSGFDAKLVFNGKYTYDATIHYGTGLYGVIDPMVSDDMYITYSAVPEEVASDCQSVVMNIYVKEQISETSYVAAKSASYAIVLQ